MDSLQGHWGFPTSISFGANAIQLLPKLAKQLKSTRPLLVTDRGLSKHSMITQAIKNLTDEGIFAQVFSDIHPNPITEDVSQGVHFFNQYEHDSVIAIGGGSAMDVGKAIALMSIQSLPISEFIDEGERWKKANTPICPIIAIPTTAGTGSEVGRCSVILDKESSQKLIIFHPDLLPKEVILDPTLTVSLPQNLTAYTGMDALSHSIEALCVDSYHPLADALAIKGVQLVSENLITAFQSPDNLCARTNMLVASTLGATAFQKGLGGMHALSHAIGGLYGCHHGLLNAILMPYVLKHNKVAIEEKISQLSISIGLSMTTFDSFLEWCLSLRESLKIPHHLNLLEVNLDPSRILPLALKDPSCAGNPVQLDSKSLNSILKNAMTGVV